ncbi:diacylglycerol kinase theta [Prunus avium]|uniref:Diacylglycerol kinase theta n=1 Tax=Prunus avium TaxID=42229 RepID=A0A6P5SHS1_PRUAV|nr:diacylglycerol kinase theta [Prunus avium]
MKKTMVSNKPLRKTRTFLLKRSESMQQPTEFVPRKSPVVEFSTSPQLIFGEEMLHFGHPQHPLSQVNLPDLFTCAGCKEYGAGKRFVCQQCDFQLHDFCALAPPALKSHPFHFQHQLVLYSKSVKGGIAQSKCDVCHKPAKGYAFRCSTCSFQMHPCCAMLSSEINLQTHPHTLRLLPATSSSNGDPNSSSSFVCGECRRKRSGRVYHCTVCNYHVHAVCAKDMINGLQDNGHKGREKPSMFGTAARLASQVVIEFIGGLIEGLGEGVAEVFVENIARSGRANGRSNNN